MRRHTCFFGDDNCPACRRIEVFTLVAAGIGVATTIIVMVYLLARIVSG